MMTHRLKTSFSRFFYELSVLKNKMQLNLKITKYIFPSTIDFSLQDKVYQFIDVDIIIFRGVLTVNKREIYCKQSNLMVIKKQK